jgi:CheY-like chemotaxis protein
MALAAPGVLAGERPGIHAGITVSHACGIITSFDCWGFAQEVRVRHILIAGKDWQARALLRAQLLEEGFEVEAYETIPDALAALGPGANLPNLFIADVSASGDPSADVEALSVWSRKLPIWIVASRAYIIEKGLRGHGFEMILLGPVDVGELVEQIKQRLEEHMEIE